MSHGSSNNDEFNPNIQKGTLEWDKIEGSENIKIEEDPNVFYPRNYHPNIMPDYNLELILYEYKLNESNTNTWCSSFSQSVEIT